MNMQQTYIRRGDERGRVHMGWLKSQHSFSFGHYFDPKHMGVSVLRVINDDSVVGGAGFHPHSHSDMEIISYVLKGAIEHKDSMGNSFVIREGEVQRMSAGTGITHSEFNASATEDLHFLQIWILPEKMGIEPSYEQKLIEQNGAVNALVTPSGENGSLSINQDAAIYRVVLSEGESTGLEYPRGVGYLHVVSGTLSVVGEELAAGDAIAVNGDQPLAISARGSVEALWFDLPANLQ